MNKFTYNDRLQFDIHAFVYDGVLSWIVHRIWNYDDYVRCMKDGHKTCVLYDRYTIHLSMSIDLEDYEPSEIAEAIVKVKQDGNFKSIRLD